MATIILLNGTSSAGKSTIAKALQNLLEPAYLHAGIDNYVFMLPKQYLNPPLWNTVFEYKWVGEAITEIKAGPLGHKLINGMHASVAALAHSGFNVVVDHVILDQRWLEDAVTTWVEFEVLFVGVRCPLDVVELRERERKDRTLGQARAQFEKVHQGKVYDLEIDTSQAAPEACAEQIKTRLDAPMSAFHKLREQFYIGRRCES